MPDIMHQIRIQATPERVYQALTLPGEIRQWWTRDAELDAKVGGKGEFAFSDRKVRTTVRIDDLKGGARVAWRGTIVTMTAAARKVTWTRTPTPTPTPAPMVPAVMSTALAAASTAPLIWTTTPRKRPTASGAAVARSTALRQRI